MAENPDEQQDEATAISLLRRASAGDVERLHRFEERWFTGDRISRRQWRYQLGRGTIEIWLREATCGQEDLQAVLVLFFRRGTRSARIYSLAVAGSARGRGLGASLLALAEERARSSGCTRLTLEVRADNTAAVCLYRRTCYRQFRVKPAYYDDGAAALCFEKPLPAVSGLAG